VRGMLSYEEMQKLIEQHLASATRVQPDAVKVR
jgi:hypothetical protein